MCLAHVGRIGQPFSSPVPVGVSAGHVQFNGASFFNLGSVCTWLAGSGHVPFNVKISPHPHFCVCACVRAGEVAGLLPKDELDMIVNDIRPEMKKQMPGHPDTWENLYTFFLNRVRDNLHIVLCFSPVGDKFSRRAMQFPGLINGCTIDW